MKNKCIINVFLLLITIPGLSYGQEFSITAEVDRARVSSNDMFVLTVMVSGNNLNEVPEPTLPALENFLIVGRNSSTSSSFNFINGKISSSQSIRYIYQLQPDEIGIFLIDAVTVSHNGKSYRTNPINIEVVQGTTMPRPSQGGRQGSIPRSLPGTDEQADLSKELFVRAVADKNQAYIGEQITMTYKLYTRVGLSNVRYDHMPSFTGFWMEEMFSAQHLDYKEEIIDGKRFGVSVLKRIALFPTVTGKQQVEPLSMLCDVQVARRRSLLDSFFNDPLDPMFSRTRQVRIESEIQTVDIQPLPEAGKPDTFKNAVGQFTVTAAIDQTTTTVSQPITLTVKLSGKGNMKTLEDPALPRLTNFKQYTSESKEDVNTNNMRIGGSKTYSYVLIPVFPGEYQIEGLTFPYFDPDTDAYKISSTPPITITVAPEQGNTAAGFTPEKIAVTQVRQDIQYIKPETVFLGHQGSLLFQTPWYLIMHALPIAALVGVILYRSHSNRLQHDVGYARWHRAHGQARRELQQAQKALDHDHLDQTYTHISNGLYQFIADKYNQATAGLTTPQIVDLLTDQKIEDDMINQVKHCLDACDMARFAPTLLTKENTKEVLDSVEKIIKALEQKMVKG
jgi:hypothetical protein